MRLVPPGRVLPIPKRMVLDGSRPYTTRTRISTIIQTPNHQRLLEVS